MFRWPCLLIGDNDDRTNVQIKDGVTKALGYVRASLELSTSGQNRSSIK